MSEVPAPFLQPFEQKAIDAWQALVAKDEELTTLLAQSTSVVLEIRSGDTRIIWKCSEGTLPVLGTPDDNPEFAYVATPEAWSQFLAAWPKSPHHSLFAMISRVEGTHIDGSTLRFAQNVHVLRRLLELGRWAHGEAGIADPSLGLPGEIAEPDVSVITGGYAKVTLRDKAYRLYYEQSGEGKDIVFLHTAGGDSRQFQRLLCDESIRANYRMTAFDLPWHGRSFGPQDAPAGSWALDTDLYIDAIMGLIDALGLESPIIMGASMAGEICLELAYRFPDQLGGVVACEACDFLSGATAGWVKHPEVNQTLYVPEWVNGMMAPQSPRTYRREIWWGYSQGGYGTFAADVAFYRGGWDARDRVTKIDTKKCPLVMMTGEYDYSCTPQMSEETAAKIPGAKFSTMYELGHFPSAENPPKFAGYLLEALKEIEAANS